LGVNNARPHIFVLPEDAANRDLANGFHLRVAWNKYRQMYVLKPAGGWLEVLRIFESEHISQMDRFANRFMLLLIDFDGDIARLEIVKARIPSRLAERVFVLGVLSEPEELKAQEGSYETIGQRMAQDCQNETNTIWSHRLLQHNAIEVERLREQVRPVLF
jgi:hypothetical protein